MGRHSIPDRWLNYKAIGSQVNGTNFIAFKVPLNNQINGSVSKNEQFSGKQLLEKVPNLGLIIDLTNTNRYYNPHEFEEKGIQYAKVMVPGHEVPQTHIRKSFSTLVKKYLQDEGNSNKLIGVHCTHGINRTGFLICFFMIQELNIDPLEAIKRFEIARGYAIERTNYINFLTTLKNSCTREIENKPNFILLNSNIDDANLKKFNMFEKIPESNKDKDFESSHQRNTSHWDVSPDFSFADRLKWNLNTNNTNLEDTNSNSEKRHLTTSRKSRSPPYSLNYRKRNSSEQIHVTTRGKMIKTSSSHTGNINGNINWRESRIRDPHLNNNSAPTTTIRRSHMNYHHSQERSINNHGRREVRIENNAQRNPIVRRSKSPSFYSYNSDERRNNNHEILWNEIRSRDKTFQNYEKHSYQSNNHNDSERFYSNNTLPYVHSHNSHVDPYPRPQQQYLNTYANTWCNPHYSNNRRSRNNDFKFD